MADDGSAVMSGKALRNFTGLDASSSSSPSSDLEYMFAAIKLDSEGAEVWRWQVRPWSLRIVIIPTQVLPFAYF